MVPGKTWVFASVSKSWESQFCVFFLVLEFCIFLQKGLGALVCLLGVKLFWKWKGKTYPSEWGKSVLHNYSSMLDEICMAFCWCTVQTHLLRFKLTRKLWNISYGKKLFNVPLHTLILCCFITWINSTVNIYNIIVHSVKFTINHSILIPLSPLFPFVSSTESSLSIRT